MRDSIIQGKLLPESLEDFQALQEQGKLFYKTCVHCNEPFEGHTHTAPGWRDTQIIGYCEDCYDELFKEGEDAPN